MNRTNLVAAMAEQTGLSKRAANLILSAFLEIIADGLAKRETIYISKLGTFKVDIRSARRIRHPLSGEILKVRASCYPRFLPSSSLKLLVNQSKK